jgi:TrkA-C domain
MGLYLLIPMFVVIVVSFLIVRVGAVALRMTGLDRNTANFQALSAFTRAGFTTRESELVVGHPQRRSIVSWLIILGNAGIVAVIVTGTSSLALTTDYRLAIAVGIVIAGLYIVYRLFRRAGFTSRWDNLIENRLLRAKRFQRSAVEQLLRLTAGHGVARVTITRKSPLAGVALQDIELPAKDVSVLGIERGAKLISSPTPDKRIEEGDALIVFGRLNTIEEFFRKTYAKSS